MKMGGKGSRAITANHTEDDSLSEKERQDNSHHSINGRTVSKKASAVSVSPFLV
jgi:hypothetical protein